MQALAVNENEDVGVAQPVHLHLAAHVVFAEGETGRQSAEYFLETAAAILLQFPPCDHFGLYGNIFQTVLRTRSRDNHFGERVILFLAAGSHHNEHHKGAPCQSFNLHKVPAPILGAVINFLRDVAGLLAFHRSNVFPLAQ